MADRMLTLVKSDSLDNWYTIEWAEHDNREWLEPTEYGFRFMMSARPSDACIEGTAEEMLAIASAIELREQCVFRRCAVYPNGMGRVALDSPRNSSYPAVVSLAVADALVAAIRATLTVEGNGNG